MRPPHISEAVDKLQNGINSPVTLSATKGFRRQKRPQQIQGELERHPKRKTDRCSQSLTGTCSLPFQSDPFWILLTSCCCGGARAAGPGLFLPVKASDLSMGLVPPSSGQNCSCCNPICSPETPPRAHHLPRVSQSFPCH